MFVYGRKICTVCGGSRFEPVYEDIHEGTTDKVTVDDQDDDIDPDAHFHEERFRCTRCDRIYTESEYGDLPDYDAYGIGW